MKRLSLLVLFGLLLLPAASPSAEKGLAVKAVRFFSYASFTRIVVEIETAAPYVLTRSADGRSLFLSSYDGPMTLKSPVPPVRDGLITGVEVKEETGKRFIIVHLEADAGEVKDFVLRGPDRIVLDIPKRNAPPAAATGGARMVITLDPGHGGRDTGIVAGAGEEKTLSLDLAQAIRKILLTNEKLNVHLTRDHDAQLTLDERAAAANASGSALFVSLHIGQGRESRVYIQDPDDNADMQSLRPESKDFLGFESGSEQQERLWGRQQAAHAKESGVLGRTLVRELAGNPAAEPIQAPIAGLKAIDAAAVLVEIGVDQDRARAAEAVARGIEQYVAGNR